MLITAEDILEILDYSISDYCKHIDDVQIELEKLLTEEPLNLSQYDKIAARLSNMRDTHSKVITLTTIKAMIEAKEEELTIQAGKQ